MKRSTLCLIVIIYRFCRLLNNPLLTKHLVFPAHCSEGPIDHNQNGTQSQENNNSLAYFFMAFPVVQSILLGMLATETTFCRVDILQPPIHFVTSKSN